MSIPIIDVELRYEEDVMHARQRARLIAELLGFDRSDQTRISTAVSELARNAYLYAGGGKVEFLVDCKVPQVFKISISDHGPGIANIDTILEGKITANSSAGIGMGIVGARRLMDFFHLETRPGEGTTILLGKSLPRTAPSVNTRILTQISSDLQSSQVHSPLEEIRLQNQELLRAMEELRRREEIIRQQATHDELTGLPNRRMYQMALTMAIAEGRRDKRTAGVVFIDLDHFKEINDTMGHEAGDKFLCAVAETIKGCVRAIDTVVRLGGDEFALILPDMEHKEDAGIMVRRIFEALKRPVAIDGTSLQPSVSIGIAVFPDDGDDINVLLKRADTAMYISKKEGHNSYRFWHEDMSDEEQASHITEIAYGDKPIFYGGDGDV